MSTTIQVTEVRRGRIPAFIRGGKQYFRLYAKSKSGRVYGANQYVTYTDIKQIRTVCMKRGIQRKAWKILPKAEA